MEQWGHGSFGVQLEHRKGRKPPADPYPNVGLCQGEAIALETPSRRRPTTLGANDKCGVGCSGHSGGGQAHAFPGGLEVLMLKSALASPGHHGRQRVGCMGMLSPYKRPLSHLC